MTNVVIIGNGNALFGTPGGVYLQEVANARIELTTITGNIGLRGGGVVCDSTGPGALITSSIIYGNMDLDAGALVDAQCLVEHSVVDAYSGPGTANTTGDPLFVAAGDVHLQATSPARGAGDPAVTARVDYDGDVRPQPAASAPDCGADEVP
jgi:hypothetical protein